MGDLVEDGDAHLLEQLVVAEVSEQVARVKDDARRLLDVVRIDVAVEYLSRTDDLIPDTTPGIGYLDDAIVIELAHRMLERELADYADFCRFRDAEAAVRGLTPAQVEVDRRDWLAWKRATQAKLAREEYTDGAPGASFQVR